MSETSETLHVIRKKLYSFSSEPNVWYTIGIIRVYVDDYHEIFYSVSLFNKINYLASLGIYLLNQLDFIEYFTIITSYLLIIPTLTNKDFLNYWWYFHLKDTFITNRNISNYLRHSCNCH